MPFSQSDTRVYVVPLIDVNWLVYAPFDPGRNYRVDPPNVPEATAYTRQLVSELRSLTDGKFILSPHSGTYCRTGLYEGELLEIYADAARGGGELAIHLHEEIKGGGTRYADWDHCKSVFEDCKSRLESVGVMPVAYRGGHYAYHPFMNRMLEENEIYADYSCAPGMNKPEREAIWTHAGLSADYLPEDIHAPWKDQSRSGVLEIPIGCDGQGSAYANLLHVEMSELDNLLRIWDAIVARAEAQDQAQIVHVLFHTASVGVPDWMERYRRFMDAVPKRSGQFITTVEAKELKDRQDRDLA